jgi:hypothetical protein
MRSRSVLVQKGTLSRGAEVARGGGGAKAVSAAARGEGGCCEASCDTRRRPAGSCDPRRRGRRFAAPVVPSHNPFLTASSAVVVDDFAADGAQPRATSRRRRGCS